MNEELWDITREEIYADKQRHICENCDDWAVCDYMTNARPEPCEAFDWFYPALLKHTAEKYIAEERINE